MCQYKDVLCVAVLAQAKHKVPPRGQCATSTTAGLKDVGIFVHTSPSEEVYVLSENVWQEQ